MPDATVKTVKIEIQAEAKNAEEAVGKVTRAVTQLQNILAKDAGMSRLGQSINNAFKSSNSSIETQMKKVASLKIAMRGLSTLYNSIKSTNAALEKAELKMEAAPLGSSKYEKAKAKVDELKDSLEYLHWQASEALDDNFTENAFVTEIIRTRDELKEEEAELRRLKKEERETASATNEEAAAEEKSGDAAKRATSSHKSFSDAMKKVGNTLKKVKSHIKSAMNGFKSIASSLKGAIPGANKFGGVIGKLANQFKRLFVMRVLRNLITSMIKGFKEGIDNVVKYSAALNGLDANNANRAMSELASTTAYLKNVLGSAAIPVLNAVIPLVRQLATAFATAVNYVNQFLSALSGKSSWTRAKQVTVDYASSLSDVGSSAGGAKDAVEDLKRTIMGFDEINKLNDATGSSGSGGGGSGSGGSDTVSATDMFEEVPIDNKVMEWLKDLKPYIDDIKDAWGRVKTSIKDLVNSEGFKYLISTTFKEVLKTIASLMGSFADTVDAFKDALNKSEIKGKIDDVAKAWDGVLKAIEDLTSSQAWKSVVEAVTFVGLSLLEGILGTIEGLIEGIRKGIEKLDENGKIQEFKDAWDKVSGAVSDLFNSKGFQDFESTVLYMAVTALTGILDALGTIINNVIIPAFDELSEMGVFDEMAKAWDDIWKAIKEISENPMVQAVMKDALQKSILAIKDHIELIAEALQTVSSILSGDIPGAIKHLGLFFINLGTTIATSVITPFETLANTLPNYLSQLAQKLPDWVFKVFGFSNEQISNIRNADFGLPKVTWVNDLHEMMNEAKGIWEKTIDEMSESGYVEVEVDIDDKEAKKGYGTFKDEVNNTVMNAPLDAKTTPAKEAYKKYKQEAEKKITSPVDANTTNATTKYTTYKTEAQKTVTSPVDANTTNATTAYNTYKSTAEKTITSPIEAKITNATTTKSDLEKILGTLALNGSFSKTDKETIKSSLDTLLSSLGLNGSFSNDNKTSIKADVASYLQTLQLNGYFTADNKYAIWSDLKTYFSDIPMKGYVAEITTPSYVNPFGNGDVTYRPAAGKFTGGIISKEIGGIVQAASGRLFDSAQIFTARENGIPEYVGRFGSHSAVANNYQIVTGIAQGVSAAMVSQNELLREQNSLLREIASKSGNTSVSSILGAMNRVNKRTGTPVVQMG